MVRNTTDTGWMLASNMVSLGAQIIPKIHDIIPPGYGHTRVPTWEPGPEERAPRRC